MNQINRRQFSLSIAATVGALASQSAVAQSGSIPIGVIFPTKSIVGRQGEQGAQIAADLINTDGGVLNGKTIKLVVYDSNFSPVEGAAAVQRMLSQDGVRIVTGEISSTVAFAVIPIAQSENALLMLAMPKHSDITKSGYEGVFRLNTTTVMDESSFFDYILKTVNPVKIAFLVQNDDYGLTSLEDAKKFFGSRVVFTDIFEVKQSDFSAMASNVRGTGADLVVITAANPEQSGNLIKSMADLGFNPKRALMPGMLNNDFPKVAGKAGEGVFSEDIYAPTIDNDVNKRFVKAYEEKYKATPGKIEALAFESVWFPALAIKKAGTATDMKKIAQTLKANTWLGPRGNVVFDATGQASSSNLYHIEVKNGQAIGTRR